MTHIETIIFDLDGTLYEDERVYDRYAQELAHFLPPDRQRHYLADWAAAKAGRGPLRVGLGYGENQYIGDWWGLADVLAAHHGIARSDRTAAFHATRSAMSDGTLSLEPEPWLHDLLAMLRAQGRRLIAMSNSPSPSVENVLTQLGLQERCDLVLSGAAKPAGLDRFLQESGAADRILSVGDHFVNDIAPALQAGSHALYIDHHDTGLGHGMARLRRISSRQLLPDVLHDLDQDLRSSP